jgi:hypothetical protein
MSEGGGIIVFGVRARSEWVGVFLGVLGEADFFF